MHAVALAAAVLLAPGIPGALTGAALFVHAILRRPRPPPPLVRLADGRWSVPDAGVSGAVLGAGTRFTRGWVRLELAARGRAPATLLLMHDQLDPEEWRALQAALRRGQSAGFDEGPSDFS